MKKVEIIRDLFDILMSCGYSDNKQDSISEYTKDKMENVIYVKKLDVVNLPNIDSIAITCLESDFSDACDCDVRVAFNDRKVGKRVILYANEVGVEVLSAIRDNVQNSYNEHMRDKNSYNSAYKLFNTLKAGSITHLFLDEEINAFGYILERFKQLTNIK